MQTAPIPEDNSSLWPSHGPAEPVADAGNHEGHIARNKPELEINTLLERRIKDWGERAEVARENLEWFQECAMSLITEPNQNGDAMMTALFDLFAALLDPPVTAPVKYLVKFYLWRCEMPLADTLLNFETPANWWREMGVSKQMCFKLANEFCDIMKLPRRSNQRDLKSRGKMRTKRLAPKGKKL